MLRQWKVSLKDDEYLDISNTITLSKLKQTIRFLKSKGEPFAENKWASPIVPLLIEHIFIEIGALNCIASITLTINEGKDIKLC